MKKIKIEHNCGIGMLWFVGWLFTVGFLQLTFGQGLWALVVWPYYIGSHFNGLL